MHMPDGSCDSWKEPHSQIMPKLGHFPSTYYVSVLVNYVGTSTVAWIRLAVSCPNSPSFLYAASSSTSWPWHALGFTLPTRQLEPILALVLD
jgi:hypothetical protein